MYEAHHSSSSYLGSSVRTSLFCKQRVEVIANSNLCTCRRFCNQFCAVGTRYGNGESPFRTASRSFSIISHTSQVAYANYLSQAREQPPEIWILINSSSVCSSQTGRRHSQTDTRPHAPDLGREHCAVGIPHFISADPSIDVPD